MKKLLVVMGIALAMATSHAASVAWNSGAIYGTDNAKVGKGNSDYTITLAFFTDAECKNAVTGLTGDLTASESGTGSKYSGTINGFAASTQYYLVATIANSGYELVGSPVSFTTAGTGALSINLLDGDNMSGPALVTQNATWTAVPEPTSGLLMLLGLAGLALKRKRA